MARARKCTPVGGAHRIVKEAGTAEATPVPNPFNYPNGFTFLPLRWLAACALRERYRSRPERAKQVRCAVPPPAGAPLQTAAPGPGVLRPGTTGPHRFPL